MVEGAALEMLFSGNVNEGSNPSLSVPNQIIHKASGSSTSGKLPWDNFDFLTIKKDKFQWNN